MQIAIISDTHMPRGARQLPDRCVELLRKAELIIHAGDVIAVAALRQLEAYGEVAAVHGNVDDPHLCAQLAPTKMIEAGGARAAALAAAHDGDRADRRWGGVVRADRARLTD